MVHKATRVAVKDGVTKVIDRTKFEHPYKLDIDVKSPSKNWVYWGSADTINESEKRIKESLVGKGTQARIVQAQTGTVLKKIRI